MILPHCPLCSGLCVPVMSPPDASLYSSYTSLDRCLDCNSEFKFASWVNGKVVLHLHKPEVST